MPKQTFFNLDGDKRETLIEALKKEFSRANVHEASISNIVKHAGIPRGSFYQYFEDKEDAFLYVLESYGKINKEWLKAYLKETNGDLFETSALLFRRLLENYSTKEHYQLFRHAFLNMNHKIEQAFTSDKVKEDMKRNMEELVQYVDYSILLVDTREELFHLLKIIKAVTFHNFIETFAHQISIDEACQQYQLELTMLKRGLLKNTDFITKGNDKDE
ncbi:TetR family transcriptional regulator [Halolactibacillus miurensis]|uniref:DNA-binding transcriptional regulator, AcrR family n=1 Tax=Halolactibacillus miurensis TaxID=306541 RepID=A0A1I6TUU8_9BACI|nr:MULTISPECIES: TetR/AcrR family transcriptional regulator [Halolactibacillus]GEM05411.1 TetR family transcriptional regulator [Halolactibacillus miurensis]SFS92944.1 DNA-binding transcriptional regulator, AcrR family [Halolactibacillus miurensis]